MQKAILRNTGIKLDVICKEDQAEHPEDDTVKYLVKAENVPYFLAFIVSEKDITLL